MSKEVVEAVKVFNDYYACPCCTDAVYHSYAFTHREFDCKDCGGSFLVPEDIKLNKPKPFKRKPRKVTNE